MGKKIIFTILILSVFIFCNLTSSSKDEAVLNQLDKFNREKLDGEISTFYGKTRKRVWTNLTSTEAYKALMSHIDSMRYLNNNFIRLVNTQSGYLYLSRIGVEYNCNVENYSIVYIIQEKSQYRALNYSGGKVYDRVLVMNDSLERLMERLFNVSSYKVLKEKKKIKKEDLYGDGFAFRSYNLYLSLKKGNKVYNYSFPRFWDYSKKKHYGELGKYQNTEFYYDWKEFYTQNQIKFYRNIYSILCSLLEQNVFTYEYDDCYFDG